MVSGCGFLVLVGVGARDVVIAGMILADYTNTFFQTVKNGVTDFLFHDEVCDYIMILQVVVSLMSVAILYIIGTSEVVQRALRYVDTPIKELFNSKT